MCLGQWQSGFAVIKLSLLPIVAAMTLLTLLAQTAFMRIVIAMAVVTVLWRITPFFAG